MMKKKLAVAIALVGLMQSSVLHALGLGEIRVSSAVNERLDAEIPLVNAESFDASKILVSLASKADFARAGVDREYFLSSLEFIVERGESGVPILRLQTPDVVLEPYLNFLVELRWPKGRLLREYTVLLDLPNYSAAPARIINPANTPQRRNDKPDTRSSTAVVRPFAGNTSNSTNKTSAQSPSSITVRADETLWGIAKRVKPNNASINQTMLALQDLNPNAFINNNINLLKKGAVLRLPQGAAVGRVNKRQAQQLVSEQQLNWQRNQDKSNEGLQAALDGREATQSMPSSSIGSSDYEGHLQLATVVTASDSALINSKADTQLSDGNDAGAANVAGAAGSSGAAQAASTESDKLRNDLAISLESLDRAAVENTAMNTRLTAMESQLSDLEQLLILKDQELASIRAAIDVRQEAQANSSVADTVVDKVTTAETSILNRVANALSISVEWLVFVGVSLFATVMAVFMWFFARREDAYEATVFERVEPLAENDLDQDDDLEQDDESILKEGAFDQTASIEQDVNTEQDTLANDLDGDLNGNVATDKTIEDFDAEHDVIAEADIYLAYGRYDQADEMLAAAIKSEPTRTDLQLKQLELFVAQQAPELFRNACQALLAQDPNMNVAAEALLVGVDSVSDWWPEGDIASPANEFLESYNAEADVEVEVEPASGELEEDKTDFGLQLAYDADSEQTDSTSEIGEANDTPEQDRQSDEVGTKLDLARVYIDMGDVEGAREILDEVMSGGSEEQRDQANAMIGKIA
ncbi:hypothetical protein N9L91_00370 [Pseudomonadales bacterium]|nr:hypothetical protein [Pseudomonadales bacterium]